MCGTIAIMFFLSGNPAEIKIESIGKRLAPHEYQTNLKEAKKDIEKENKYKHNKSISGDIYHNIKPKIYNVDNVKISNNELHIKINNQWYVYDSEKSTVGDISYSDLANAKKFKGYVNKDKNTIDIQKLYQS